MIDYLDFSIIGSVLYQSLVTASFGFVIWMRLLKKYKVSSLHFFIFITPVSGVLLSHIILHEPVTMNILLSLFLISSGLIVLQIKQKKPKG